MFQADAFSDAFQQYADVTAFDPASFQNDAFQIFGVSSKGGAGKFSGLSRGMLVVDQEAWEEEGIILPLLLDDFP